MLLQVRAGLLGIELQLVAHDAPAIAAAQDLAAGSHDPLPADTLFMPRRLQQADAVLAMYHDQGLPVIKHIVLAARSTSR